MVKRVVAGLRGIELVHVVHIVKEVEVLFHVKGGGLVLVIELHRERAEIL